MKAQKALLFSIFSGLLFVFAWPVNGFSIFIFGSFVPLFFVEHSFAQSKKKYAHWRFFGWSYLVFLIWNLGTTWWLINATVFGMLFANLCNSLFFALLFQAFHWSKKRLPLRSAYLFLITLWLAFEKFHLSWDFSWPWLNLGHVFSESIYWIQWYEYTGAFGGSLWVLLVNIFLFEKLNNWTVDQGQTALVKKTNSNSYSHCFAYKSITVSISKRIDTLRLCLGLSHSTQYRSLRRKVSIHK